MSEEVTAIILFFQKDIKTFKEKLFPFDIRNQIKLGALCAHIIQLLLSDAMQNHWYMILNKLERMIQGLAEWVHVGGSGT